MTTTSALELVLTLLLGLFVGVPIVVGGWCSRTDDYTHRSTRNADTRRDQ